MMSKDGFICVAYDFGTQARLARGMPGRHLERATSRVGTGL